MSRIGDFADDDAAAWVVKSPDIGMGMVGFTNAVYKKNRLPMRVRELARMVIALDNECVVCQNTRDAEGIAAGVDEDLYDHAAEWRTWPGYSSQERIAAEFAERFAADHTGLRDDEDFWNRARRALQRRADDRPGAVLRDVARHGPHVANARHRPNLQDHLVVTESEGRMAPVNSRAAKPLAAAAIAQLESDGVATLIGTVVSSAGLTHAKTIPLRKMGAFADPGLGASPVWHVFTIDQTGIALGGDLSVVGDQRIRIDLGALRILGDGLAWAPGAFYDQDGEPDPYCSRGALGRIERRLADAGFDGTGRP